MSECTFENTKTLVPPFTAVTPGYSGGQRRRVPAFPVSSPACSCETAPSEEASAELKLEVPMVIPSRYFAWRIWLDRFLALLLLLPGIPMMLVVSTLLFLTSDGPILYRQRRVGLRGKVFTLMKFRTMIRDAEKKTGPVWTSVNDPRITKLGKFLRPTHLDELPQLFNVLMGQMALIGPRPERPEFTCRLEKEIPGYMNRCLVVPGISGLAQVNLPGDTDLDSVRRKLTLDLEYIETANLRLDFRLFLCTTLRLFGIPGNVGARWTKVEREVAVPEYMKQVIGTGEMIPATFVDQERAMEEKAAEESLKSGEA